MENYIYKYVAIHIYLYIHIQENIVSWNIRRREGTLINICREQNAISLNEVVKVKLRIKEYDVIVHISSHLQLKIMTFQHPN